MFRKASLFYELNFRTVKQESKDRHILIERRKSYFSSKNLLIFSGVLRPNVIKFAKLPINVFKLEITFLFKKKNKSRIWSKVK